MKKTKAKVKDDIKKREQFAKESLSLGGWDESAIESFFKESGFINPIQLIRLRSPEYGLPTVEINGIPHLTMKDDGFLDHNNYIYVKIRPDTPRALIHHYLDETLDLHHSQSLPKKQTRLRADEILQAWKIWEYRRQRKSFPVIAKELEITEDAARKLFYRAYERFYSKKYKAAEYERPEIKKEYLKRTCETCIEKPTCKDLCPDVLEFVSQNTSYLRESLSKK